MQLGLGPAGSHTSLHCIATHLIVRVPDVVEQGVLQVGLVEVVVVKPTHSNVVRVEERVELCDAIADAVLCDEHSGLSSQAVMEY